MPLIKSAPLAAHAFLGIWKATEPLDFFSSLPQNYIEGFDQSRFSAWRKKEFLASRFLLWQMLKDDSVKFGQDENGRLLCANRSENISITHSGDMVGAIISGKRKVGIDIEAIRPKVLRIRHKFINENEAAVLGQEPSVKDLILCWSAKETVYKLMRIPGLSFKEQILLQLPSNILSKGNLCAQVYVNAETFNLELQYEFFDNYVLTYCIELPTLR